MLDYSHSGRPPALSSTVEAELKLACASILQDTIPTEFQNDDDCSIAAQQYDKYLNNDFESNRVSVTDFPIPSTSTPDASKYAYRPDVPLEDVLKQLGVGQTSLGEIISRRPSELQSQSQTETIVAKSLRVSTNIARDKRASDTGPRASNAPRPSAEDVLTYSLRTDLPTAAVSGRKRMPSTSGARSKPDLGHSAHNRPNRAPTLSRTQSITRSLREYVKPGSTSQSRSVSRAPSTFSVSSSASSVVVPLARARRFSFKNLRQSWNSWNRVSEQDSTTRRERSRTRGRGDHHRSGSIEQSHISVNLNGDLPPLPGLYQWQAAEFPEASGIPEDNPKPKHISSMWSSKPRQTGKVEGFRIDVESKTDPDRCKPLDQAILAAQPLHGTNLACTGKRYTYQRGRQEQ